MSSKPNVHNTTTKDLVRWANEHGYRAIPKRGKGSHIRMVHENGKSITIPGKGHIGRNVVRIVIKTVLGE